jgi:hypothetical protein
MFGIFSKKKRKEKIDSILIQKMKEYSDETEKVFRNLIDYSITDFPHENIKHSDYGTYKARLGTNLMIAIGTKFSKQKIGFDSNEEFFNDIQIASAIAHQPFADENNINYLPKNSISEQTEEIIKYFLLTVKDNQESIYKLSFKPTDTYFKKIKTYFNNCASECVESKNIMTEIINLNQIYFDNLTRQNLKIMSDFMKI